MKISKITLGACLSSLVIVSCEGNGPKASFSQPEQSVDEIMEETFKALENDSYVYMGSVELHYYDGGWRSAGMYKLYNYPKGQRDYILFGSSDYMQVYRDTNRGWYYRRVRHQGTDYYY